MSCLALLNQMNVSNEEFVKKIVIECAKALSMPSEDLLNKVLRNPIIAPALATATSIPVPANATAPAVPAASVSETVATEKTDSKKKRFSMPFLKSAIQTKKCQGLDYNCGLFTQCKKMPEEGRWVVVDGITYPLCSDCLKDAENNDDKLPTAGTVQQRCACDVSCYKDKKGKGVVLYVSYLEKKEISVDDAKQEGVKLGLNDEQMAELNMHLAMVPNVKRGRPKAEKSDTVEPKKSAGRPKKADKEEKNADLFASVSEEPVSVSVSVPEPVATVSVSVPEPVAVEKPEKPLSKTAIHKLEVAARKAEKEAKKSSKEDKPKEDKKPKKEKVKEDKEDKPKDKEKKYEKVVFDDKKYYVNTETGEVFEDKDAVKAKTPLENLKYDIGNKVIIPVVEEDDTSDISDIDEELSDAASDEESDESETDDE